METPQGIDNKWLGMMKMDQNEMLRRWAREAVSKKGLVWRRRGRGSANESASDYSMHTTLQTSWARYSSVFSGQQTAVEVYKQNVGLTSFAARAAKSCF